MVEEVIWLKRALKSFAEIISYLHADWSDKIAVEFHFRTHLVIDLIKDFPEIGIIIKQRKIVRRFLITNHNYLIYRVYKNKLIIVDIIDTRKNEN